jgi:predicted ATP-grasp superfamily ATP-dependent carboligase
MFDKNNEGTIPALRAIQIMEELTLEKINKDKIYEEVSKYKNKKKKQKKENGENEDRISYQNFLKVVVLTINQA